MCKRYGRYRIFGKIYKFTKWHPIKPNSEGQIEKKTRDTD